jgi:DNA-binding beta-propeller fold protein YncE
LVLGFVAGVSSVAPGQAQEMCGGQNYPFPFTDVSGVGAAFCPGIMEAYVTGISKGTTATTFSPNLDVTRVQMSTFLQRSADQVLTRASRRAALNQWWTSQNTSALQSISVGGFPERCVADGESIWTTTNSGATVVQVQASTGKVLGTWTGAPNSWAILAALGKIFVTGLNPPGTLYVIDPTQSPGAVTVAASTLGNNPAGIVYDGTNLWTANNGSSVSIIMPTPPYTVTNVTTGFNSPSGILYDGAHIWVTDASANTLLKLDASGNILQTVSVGGGPQNPLFDGANIWVPNSNGNSMTVVQASTGNVVATIASDANNMLDFPTSASFDGERILVTNYFGSTITMFKASDLSFITNVPTAADGTCSDGINFWVVNPLAATLIRF